MSSLLVQCQWLHDNAQPEDRRAEEERRQFWIEDAAERMVRGEPLVIGGEVKVTQRTYLLAVQYHLTCRLEQDEDLNFARMVIAVSDACAYTAQARSLLGPTDHGLGVLHQIAEDLVTPFAAKGMEMDDE